MLKHTNWKAAATALLLGVMAAIYIGKLPPAIPVLRAEFHLSLGQSAWMVSMFNTLGVVASIFMGLIAARAGAWCLCVTGCVAMLLGAVAGMFASGSDAAGATLLLASRFLEGVGFLCIVVAAPGLLMLATVDADRKRVFSFWGAYMPTGTTLGMLLAPLLIAAQGWRALWGVTALFALAAIALLWVRRRDYAAVSGVAASVSPSGLAPVTASTTVSSATADATSGAAAPATGSAAASWRASAAPLGKAGPWWISLAFGCYAFNFYAIMVWLPTFMVGERQTPLLTASLLTALMVAVNIPGNLLGGVLMQRGVARGTNICIAGVATAITAAVIFSPALPDTLRYLACVAFSFGVGVLPGSVMSAVQIHATSPAQVGTVQGMINQGSNMGQFVSPLLVTAVVGGTVGNSVASAATSTQGGALAWNNMLWLLLATSAIIVVSGLMVRHVERRMLGGAAR